MRELGFKTVIAKPRSEVWNQLRDLRAARHYVPGVTAIEFNSSQHEGVGASRKVYMNKRPPVDETAIAWEDGKGFTLKIHIGDKPAAPFKWATFKYEAEDSADGQTIVRGTFSYEMGMGLFGRILDALVIKKSIAATNAALEVNMRKYYETGQSSNPGTV